MSIRTHLFITLQDSSSDTAMRKHVATLNDKAYTRLCLETLDTERDVIEVTKTELKPLIEYATDHSDQQTLTTIMNWLRRTPGGYCWPGFYAPDQDDALSHEIELW